jgi:hypothetical protein
MVRYLAGAIALACAGPLFAGCATIVHGTTQQIQVDSIPPGADVAIDDSEQHVITPISVKLARGSPHRLVFHKAGYQDATRKLTSGPSGWILGNVIAGGVVGIAIDASDGAGRKLSADSVDVTLTPSPAAPNAATAHEVATPVAARETPHKPKVHDVQPVVHEGDSAGVPARANGPALEDFSDDEAGYASPVIQKQSPDGR